MVQKSCDSANQNCKKRLIAMGATSSLERTSDTEELFFWNSPKSKDAGQDNHSTKRRDSQHMESGNISTGGMNCAFDIQHAKSCGFPSATATRPKSKDRKVLLESDLISQKSEFHNWNLDFCWCSNPDLKSKPQHMKQTLPSPRNAKISWSGAEDSHARRRHSENNHEHVSPALRTISASDSNKLRHGSPASPALRALDGIEHAHGIPSWAREPTPLAGWSAAEQQTIINAIHNCHPGTRLDEDHRRAAFAKLIGPGRPLAGRSVWECEECFAHVQANSIAFFGPSHHHHHHHRHSAPAHHHRHSAPALHHRSSSPLACKR
jgi:hypothetical protein